MYTECMKSELDLFAQQPLQTNILKTEEVVYKPLTSLDNPTTIEFACFGHGDAYYDLSSILLRFKVQLTKADGTLFVDADNNQAGFVNNILHSLIQQVNISLNGKNISNPDNNYAYRAYIETLLNYGNDAGKTHLEMCGWIQDGKASNAVANLDGLKLRSDKTKNSKILEVVGKIHADMLNQPLLLLNNVDIRVTLSMHKPDFYLLTSDATNTAMLKIISASLSVNHVTVNPNILIAHHKLLEKTNAKYPYKKVEVKSFTVSPKGNILSLENVVLGQIPTRLVFGMVDTDAYVGKRAKNPFNFKNNKMSSFALYVNGTQIPSEAIEMDFTHNNITARAYSSLFQANGILHANEGNAVTMEQFTNGYTLLAFDLTSDLSGSSSCKSLLDQGTIRIEARFEEALNNTITCLVFLEFDALLEIDKNRNIILNN